ncbi:MAG: ABC transporter permease [Rhodospirillaceae bacterium]|nr:ABC transporter permease [Rhodospirillaceae bacterium]
MTKKSGNKMIDKQRLTGFIRKEWLQIVRDPSSIVVAFVLPLILLFVFGYGVSLDSRNQPVAVVLETNAPEGRDFLASLRATRYLVPRLAVHRGEATTWLVSGDVKAIVLIGAEFGERLNGSVLPSQPGQAPVGAPIQVLINATDANTGRLLAGYVQGAWGTWLTHRSYTTATGLPTLVNVESRIWFNQELDSHKSIVPGLVAVVMTLIGALLTALVVAREWERGTMEALLTTPLTRAELLIGKLVPYFGLGMGGMTISVVVALILFGLPFRGSILLMVLSAAVFMLVVLGLGLAVSTITRNQFAASIIGITATMMPAVLLSGLIFDIRSMPKFIQLFTYVFPARYFVDILKSLFLVGNVWPVILPNLAALAFMATVFMTITVVKTRRTLD